MLRKAWGTKFRALFMAAPLSGFVTTTTEPNAHESGDESDDSSAKSIPVSHQGVHEVESQGQATPPATPIAPNGPAGPWGYVPDDIDLNPPDIDMSTFGIPVATRLSRRIPHGTSRWNQPVVLGVPNKPKR